MDPFAANAYHQALNLSDDARTEHRYEDALHHTLIALRHAEGAGDQLRQSRAHAEHARILSRMTLYSEAISAAYVARRLAQGDPMSIARALAELGTAQQAVTDFETQFRTHEEMLDVAESAGDLELQARALRGLCIAHLIRHERATKDGTSRERDGVRLDAEAALHLAARAIDRSRSANDEASTFLGRHLQVGALMRAGHIPEARTAAEGMLQDSEAIPLLWPYQSLAHKQLGQLALIEGDLPSARLHTAEALSRFESKGDLRQAADCQRALSEIFERAEDYRAALDWQRRSTDAFLTFASASARAHASAMAVREDAERARAQAEAERIRANALQRDNDQLVRETEQLARTALEDVLTGLTNRRGLDLRLAALITEQQTPGCNWLALLDIDHFKQINDRFLHITGDKVLARLGVILRRLTRTQDVVARFGGEEFAVVFENIEPTEVIVACERLREAVELADWKDLDATLSVTVSIGLCSFDEAPPDVEELVKIADQRLYAAKRGGRNRVVGSATCGAAAIRARAQFSGGRR